MFEQLEENEPEEQKPTDWSGTIIGLSLLPMVYFFDHIGKSGMGLSAFVYLGMTLLAIRIRWNLRTYVWFWVVIALVLVLHVLFLLKVSWPQFTVNRITLLPIGVADLLVVLGIIQFVEKFIVKAPPVDDE